MCDRQPTCVSSSAIPGLPFGFDDTRSENYDFTFTTPQTSVGLWVGNLNPGFNTVTVQFLDDDGVVIGTLPLTTLDSNLIVGSAGQFDNRLFVGINSSTPVKSIRVVQPDGDADGIVFDDVVWGAAASNPLPILTSLSPASGTVGGAGFTLTVNGSNFVPGAEVRWNGAARSTTFVNSGQLLAAIAAADLAATGTATVTASNPAPGGGTSNGLPFAVVAAAVQLTATDADAAELGPNTATFTVTRSGSTTLARDVSITVGGTASNTIDYSVSSTALLGPATGGVFDIRIPAGQASATITVTPIFNPEVEGPETVILTAEGSSATATIADEAIVTLAATDAAAAELGPNTATFVVTRGGAVTYDRDVRISVGGTASNNIDYSIAQRRTPRSRDRRDIRHPDPGRAGVRHDHRHTDLQSEVEGSETVILTAEGSSATATIADEPTVTIAATDPAASEAGPDPATFVVTRGGAVTYDRDVRVTVGGAASNTIDYSVSSTALLGPATGGIFDIRIPSGQTSVTLTVTPIPDALLEGVETITFTVEGSTAGATIVDQFSSLNFTVTTTADSGPGSLRQAILDANANPATDIISFAIPGTGVHTIAPLSPLPTIADPVAIDGTTQPGYTGTPLIELNGTSAGATSNGLFITASNSSVRGLVINRFGTGGAAGALGGAGIVIQLGGTNILQSNYLGTDPTGTIALPNRSDGIFLDRSPSNAIGGGGVGANVISGNTRNGITLSLAATTGNLLLGNFIGTDPSGNTAVGNGDGVAIFDAPANLVGVAGRNVISGNRLSGITISGVDAHSNIVANNLIGANAAGSAALPNGTAGVIVTSSASDNFIGAVGGVNANIIAFNAQSGVRVITGINNSIRGNAMFQNGQLGIDLGIAGVTPNDTGDADGNGNNQQNFPVLTAAPGGVQGTLNSTPNTAFVVELFGNTACDASGRGEGATFLTAVAVATDGTGNATIPFVTVAAGQVVTSTATDADNNTSEFSNCVEAVGAPTLTAVTPGSGQQGATLNVSLTGVNTTFVQGTSTASFGQGITVNSLTVTSPTAATANITISPTAFTGGRSISVTTGSEVASNTFAVTAGPAALTVITPTSAQQGQSNLNISIAGQNTHFVQGVTTASFGGGGVIVNLVTVNSPTSATVNISLEPFAQDARTVSLTTDGENAVSAANAFAILPGTPRLTALSPASGQQGQTLSLAVTGLFTGFVNGTTTANFGAGITVNSVTVTSTTVATVNIAISPLAAVGNRTVTLTTGAQSASSLDAGSFFAVTAGNAAVAQVSPSSGRQAENLTVTVTGTNTHLANGSTVMSFGGDITVTSVLVNSPTSATVNISVSPSASLGAHTVTATTLGEVATLSNGFTVTAGLPTISTVSPTTGRQAETLSLGIVGQFTHFAAGSTTANLGAGVTVNSVSVIDATHATVNVTVAPGAAPGSRTVVLTTGAETAQQVGGFTVTPGQPTLFSISPVSAIQGTNATVILNGAFTNFSPGLTTVSFGAGISVGTVTVNGPTLASVPISIAAGATVGARSVSITTGTESVTLLNGFTVLQGVPTITSIDPNAGQRGLTRNVTITGAFTNWQAGVTSVSYGAGVTVNSNVVGSTTALTTNITIDVNATLGPRDVVITTGTDVLTVPGGFVVNDTDVTAPALLTISPPVNATGVPVNTVVTAEFNEPLNRSTVTTSSFQLYDSVTGQYLGGTVTLDATGRVATFVPGQLLAVNRVYYAYLNNPITDVAGNHLGGGQYSYFTTGFSTDTTGPTLRLTSPQSGDTGIGRNAKISLQFDRPINAATRATGLRIQTSGVNVPGTYTLEDGQRRIRFTSATQLGAGTDYTVTLTSDLRDIAGNSLTNPGSFVFTTGAANDTTSPTVSAYSPVYNDAEVGLRPEIRVAFNEAINPISINNGTFYLYYPGVGVYIRSTITVAADRRSALLTPDVPLEKSTQYYYYLTSFEDLVGNIGSLGGSVLPHGQRRRHGRAQRRRDLSSGRHHERPGQRAGPRDIL